MLNRIEELEGLVKKYSKEYYSGESTVSDEYFDSLVDELRSLDPNSEVLTTGWGYEPSGSKVTHLYNLFIGSLSKVKSFSSIPERFLYSDRVRVSAKLDGLSVVSYYKNGRRFLSLTRGNGSQGIDVTEKITAILHDENKIVRHVDGTPFSGAIRGEVVMSNKVWNSKYKPNLESPTNPRNIASGILNRDEVSEELSNLDYVIYKVLKDESDLIKSIDDVNRFLVYNFSFFVDYYIGIYSEQDLQNFFDEFSRKYPCDGLVVTRCEDLNYDELAYKFQAESKEVVVTKVNYEASRTGRIVPVINFDPVELSGAKVKRCTGYNASFIADNLIGPGAVIEVCRSNEVIPTVMRVVVPADKAEVPTECPR